MAQVETPCIRICKQDNELGFCIGCGRTIMEVFQWYDMTPEQRKALMEKLPERLKEAGLASRSE
jgi:predicted Fe-S protein YdhL (DUF1289 family)